MAGGPVVVQATPTSWVEGSFNQEGAGSIAALKFMTVNGSSELEEVRTGIELIKPPAHTVSRSDVAYLTVPTQSRLQNSDQPLMDYEERKDLFEVRPRVRFRVKVRVTTPRSGRTCSRLDRPEASTSSTSLDFIDFRKL